MIVEALRIAQPAAGGERFDGDGDARDLERVRRGDAQQVERRGVFADHHLRALAGAEDEDVAPDLERRRGRARR